MKIAISLPDDLGKAVTRAAKKQDMSRSAYIAEALRSYSAESKESSVTAAINKALNQVDQNSEAALDSFTRRGVLRNEW